MIPFMRKASKVKSLAKSLLKSEVLDFHICTGFQRTLFANNKLFSNNIYKNEIIEQDLQFPESQKDFGKIIELGADFDELKIETIKNKRGKRNISAENTEVKMHTKRNEIIHENPVRKVRSLNENCALFSSLMTQLKSKKNREKNQCIILEGKRLIKFAISAGCKPVKIFFCREQDLEELQLPEGISAYKLTYKTIGLWSDVLTSQGIIGIFKMPNNLISKNNAQSLPLTIICDNVRDPGNLGSILRVTASVGCKKLILTKGCVNIWEPKVLRAGAGAHFQLPEIKNNLLWPDIEKEISEDTKVLLADLSSLCSQTSGDNTSDSNLSTFRRRSEFSENLPMHCYYSLKYGNESSVIIIGGETQGISDDAYKFTLERKGNKIFIPMSNQIESLNNSVALGILAYEFKRQFDINREKDS